jgi:ElaB/YqjD/DUF883 family membrane-anchored ribosome-binding protein
MTSDAPTPAEPEGAAQIRADIEETQQQLGETVEALAAKTDVKARAHDRIEEVKANASQLKDDVVNRAREAAPASAGAGAQQVSATVQERPLPFATAGAFAAGLLVGWLLGRR